MRCTLLWVVRKFFHALIALAVGDDKFGSIGEVPEGFSVMAGLDPATHAVRRVERPRVSCHSPKTFAFAGSCCGPRQCGQSLRRLGVDGRVEPGHDDGGSGTQSAMAGPTTNAISAFFRPRKLLKIDLNLLRQGGEQLPRELRRKPLKRLVSDSGNGRALQRVERSIARSASAIVSGRPTCTQRPSRRTPKSRPFPAAA